MRADAAHYQSIYRSPEDLLPQWFLLHDRVCAALVPSIDRPPNYPFDSLHIGDLDFLRAELAGRVMQKPDRPVRVISNDIHVAPEYLRTVAPRLSAYPRSSLDFPADKGVPGLPFGLQDLSPNEILILADVVQLQPRPLTLLKFIIKILPPGSVAIGTMFMSAGGSINLFSQLGFTLLSPNEVGKLSTPAVSVTVLTSREGSDQWPAFRRSGLIIENTQC